MGPKMVATPSSHPFFGSTKNQPLAPRLPHPVHALWPSSKAAAERATNWQCARSPVPSWWQRWVVPVAKMYVCMYVGRYVCMYVSFYFIYLSIYTYNIYMYPSWIPTKYTVCIRSGFVQKWKSHGSSKRNNISDTHHVVNPMSTVPKITKNHSWGCFVPSIYGDEKNYSCHKSMVQNIPN